MIKNTFSLPKFFVKDHVFDVIKADDLSYVEYRQYQEQGKNELLLTSYMFVVVLCGTKHIHTGSHTFEIGNGNGFFARKGSYIVSERMSSETGRFESLIFFFEDRFLLNFITQHVSDKNSIRKNNPQPDILPVSLTPFLKTNIEAILPHFAKQTEHSKNILRLKFEEILLNLLDGDVNHEFHNYLRSFHQDRKKDLADIVEKNLTKPLNNEELAKMSGRSLTTFKRDFYKTFGESPRGWINKKRVERAYSILKSTDKNVTDVCYETGFSSISHFIQLFRNSYGITPKQFQKDQAKQKKDHMR